MEAATFLPVPGIRLASVAAGIKKPDRRDLTLVELSEGTRVAAVLTRNRFRAAPVRVVEKNLAAHEPRYLMINTGFANAATGEAGLALCQDSCKVLATQAGCSPDGILPFSTGVIGGLFPLDVFEKGLPQALKQLDAKHWLEAAEGIMTTDTHPKTACRQLEVEGHKLTITGMAKGSGMIKPNMATMLGFIATDAKIDKALLQRWVKELADVSFNCVSVDGDTSTNDACVLMATGQAGNPAFVTGGEAGAADLFAALKAVFVELAQSLARDGEGATKFVTVEVTHADTPADARAVAETIAHSPLVKTALFASDPNWGRILAAVGRAPVAQMNINKVRIWLGDVLIVADGGMAPGYTEEAGAAVMAETDITISVDLAEGAASQTLWTCDFSYDYVKINAEYRT